MPETPATPDGGVPWFSVIIPLEFHRGQWEQSWLGWTSQTLGTSLYEIILVVPPDFSSPDVLKTLAGNRARIEDGCSKHDIGLAAFGATKARGKYLFFTESHCWPEPDVLEFCMRAIDAHTDWAGFSCRSVPICHNRLSEAEAAMYQADIEFGMKQHPWRKVLDQCFVTRRDVYEECGGLREELGHFAEWVLAANYYARGYAIGYLEEARFHHYYVGRIADLETFTLDFVEGEIRYLSEERHDPGRELIEAPIEWSGRDRLDGSLPRAALNALLRYSLASGGRKQPEETLRALWRWIAPSLRGGHAARASARIVASYAHAMLAILAAVGSREAIALWMRRYIASLIRLQRLDAARRLGWKVRSGASVLGDRVLAQAGFHLVESACGQAFCWSEPQAAIRIKGASGRNAVRIKALPFREPLDAIGAHFYLDGTRVNANAIAIGADGYTLSLDLPPSGIAVLAWACPVFRGIDDARRLGLAVASIEVVQEPDVGEDGARGAAGMSKARSVGA